MSRRAYQGGVSAALERFKLSEWNWNLTGGALKKDKIQADNGRRQYGTNFDDPARPNRSVSRAFDGLNTQRNSDHINAGNEAFFGTPS